MSNKNRVAVVTGAAGTIGRGVVEMLLEHGRRVVMVDLHEGPLREAAQAFSKDRVLTVSVDICADDGPQRIDDAARAAWGAPTILVNNAGISPKHKGLAASIFDVTRDEWLRVLDVNVTAQMKLAARFIPAMREARWGRIVNVASRAGRSNVNNSGPAYVTSKAAVLGLTRSIACNFALDGITCNSVAPGFVDSAMSRQLPPHQFQLLVDRTPLGRGGTPRELGAAIAFLASEDAGFITGACLDVNGGQTMM